MIAVLNAASAVRSHPNATLLAGQVAVVLGYPFLGGSTAGRVVLTSAALHVPFYLFVSYALVRYLFHDQTVTHDEFFATAAAFTVVAWAFAYAYVGVQALWRSSSRSRR